MYMYIYIYIMCLHVYCNVLGACDANVCESVASEASFVLKEAGHPLQVSGPGWNLLAPPRAWMGFKVPNSISEAVWDFARLWATGWAVQACAAPLTVQDVKAAIKELPSGECLRCPEIPGPPEVGITLQVLVITLALTAACCCAAGAGLTVLTGAVIAKVKGARIITGEASPSGTVTPSQWQQRGIRN